MKTSYTIFARPFGGADADEFVALTGYAGDLKKVREFAAARGCEITRIYDESAPVERPDFAKCVNL